MIFARARRATGRRRSGRRAGRRRGARLVMLGSQSGLASPKVALLEVIYVGRVNAPVVAASVARLAHLDEAFV